MIRTGSAKATQRHVGCTAPIFGRPSAIDEAVAKHADKVAAGEAVGPTKMRGAPYVGCRPLRPPSGTTS